MKRLLPSISALLFFYQVSAQTTPKFEHTDKGTHLAGGTTVVSNSFAYGNQKNLFTFNLNPNYGYFVANKFAIGGELSFLYSASSTNASSSSNLSSTTAYTRGILSPFVRYYVGAPKVWMFFGYASAGGGWQNYNNQNVGLYTYQVGPGLDFFVNEHVAFETILSYSSTKLNTSNTGYNNSLGLKIGLQIFF